MNVTHRVNNLGDNSYSHDVVVEDCHRTLSRMEIEFSRITHRYDVEKVDGELFFYAVDEKQAYEILDDIREYYKKLVKYI
jgi:hypothetical protein